MVRFLAWLALAAAGCGDDGSPSDVRDAGPTVIASGEVRRAMRAERFEDLGPVEGATVCVHGIDAACATTNAAGAYELAGLPAGAEVALSFSAEGYQSALLPLVTDDRPIRPSIALEPADAIAARDAAAGATTGSGQGSIGFIVFDGTAGVADVSVAVSPPGAGPFYVDADYAVDPTASSTSARGFGFVLGLAAGTAELRFSHPTLACDVPVLGWPGPAGAVRAPVIGGFETSVGVICQPM